MVTFAQHQVDIGGQTFTVNVDDTISAPMFDSWIKPGLELLGQVAPMVEILNRAALNGTDLFFQAVDDGWGYQARTVYVDESKTFGIWGQYIVSCPFPTALLFR